MIDSCPATASDAGSSCHDSPPLIQGTGDDGREVTLKGFFELTAFVFCVSYLRNLLSIGFQLCCILWVQIPKICLIFYLGDKPFVFSI